MAIATNATKYKSECSRSSNGSPECATNAATNMVMIAGIVAHRVLNPTIKNTGATNSPITANNKDVSVPSPIKSKNLISPPAISFSNLCVPCKSINAGIPTLKRV